jgi:serine/threonine-protein kinase RsbW
MSEQVSLPATGLAARWPADPLALSGIRAAVRQFARSAGAHERTIDDIVLAVSEAANNSVIHAFNDHRPRGSITITARVEKAHLWLEVADDGTGLRPRSDSPGLGLGLAIIARLSAELRITEAPQSGTCVTMRFALAPAP